MVLIRRWCQNGDDLYHKRERSSRQVVKEQFSGVASRVNAERRLNIRLAISDSCVSLRSLLPTFGDLDRMAYISFTSIHFRFML